MKPSDSSTAPALAAAPEVKQPEWVEMVDNARIRRRACVADGTIGESLTDVSTQQVTRACSDLRRELLSRGRGELEAELVQRLFVARDEVMLAIEVPMERERVDVENPYHLRGWLTVASELFLLVDAVELIASESGPTAEINRRKLVLLDEQRVAQEARRRDVEKLERDSRRRRFEVDRREWWLRLPPLAQTCLLAAAGVPADSVERRALVALARAARHAGQPHSLPYQGTDTDILGAMDLWLESPGYGQKVQRPAGEAWLVEQSAVRS